MKQIYTNLVFVLISIVSNTSFANSFYVSTTGLPTNTGSITNPWSLAHALSHPSAVMAGDTIWLKGGDYIGEFTSNLNGMANAYIYVRNYNKERVKLIHPCNAQNSQTLLINGSYTAYWGLEITSNCSNRVKLSTLDLANDTSFHKISAININTGHHIKMINLVIHNINWVGIGLWRSSVGSEVYGCLIFNNGSQDGLRGHGHGIYTQNIAGVENTKYITNNFIFNNFGVGSSIYSSTNPAGGTISDYTIKDNVFFNAAAIADSIIQTAGNYNFLIGSGYHPAQRIFIQDNIFYRDIKGKSIKLGYGTNVVDSNMVFSGNLVYGGKTSSYPPILMRKWQIVDFINNTIISPESKAITWESGTFDQALVSSYNWDNNNYYNSTTIGSYTNSLWQSTCLNDINSVFSPNQFPAGSIKIVQNTYEPKKLYVSVLNWEAFNTVSLNLDAYIAANSNVKIYDIQNIFGSPVVSSTYTTGGISVPLNLTQVNTLLGTSPVPVKHTTPKLGTFIVEFETANTSSISETVLPNISLFPNPSNGNFSIKGLDNNSNFTLEVYNSVGQTVANFKNQTECNLNGISKGLYVVKIKQGNKIAFCKLILE